MTSPALAAMPSAAAGAVAAGRRVDTTAAVGGSPVRRPWCGAGQLGEEGGAPGAVGEQGDAVAAAGDRHVEDPPLLLDVLGQTVRHHPIGDAEHGDTVPLPSLHPVDRRERDPGGIGCPLERRPQPCLEAGRLGVQVGDAEQTVEVVEVARPLAAARAVEEAHRRAQPDVVAHRLQHVTRRAVAAGVDDDLEVVDEAQHLAGVLLRHLVGDRCQLGERPPRAPVEPFREPLRQARASAGAGPR